MRSSNILISGYETCIVPATGTVSVDIEGKTFDQLGNRGIDVWDGEPEGAYVPVGAKVRIVCQSNKTETFIAGAKYDKVLEPFDVRKAEIDLVQYGSDETKTHRKIKHILGANQHGKVGRLLVSELFTVGEGVGPAFQVTNMIQIVFRMKPGMMKLIISVSNQTMAQVCKCFKGKIINLVMLIILWTDQRC